MKEEQEQKPAGVRPSQIAITQMLAEVESRRKSAARYWLLALLAPLLIGAGLLAFTSYIISKRLNQLADLDLQIANKQEIIKQKDTAISEREQAIKEKDQAIEAKTQVIAKVYEENPAARAEIISAIEANPTAAAATPRVFIHYPEKGQKDWAGQLRGAIRGLGYVVPDTDLVPSSGRNAEVRYFFPDDRDAAEKVAGVLAGQGVSLRVAQRSAPGAKPGLVEVWLPASPPSTPERPAEGPRVRPDLPQGRPGREADNNPRTTAPRPSRSPY